MSLSQKIKSEFRRKAREKYWGEYDRSTYSCADCGRQESELLEKMEVHHIDGNPSNNSLDNLVGLCQVCHNLREEKKPSIRKTSHLIKQFSGDEAHTPSNTVPVCKTQDEYGAYVEDCFEQKKPALVVNMAGKRKWASVEIDMLSLGGVFEVTNADSRRSLTPVLSREAASCINAICDRYRDAENGDFRGSAMLSVPSEPMNGYHSFPSMKADVAQSFANELKSVVENPAFWQCVPGHLSRTIEKQGRAIVQMKELEWLPNTSQRGTWEVTEEDLRVACERCGNDFADLGPNEPHCDSCKRHLVWDYSECGHEKTHIVNSSGELPDSVANASGELLVKCDDCGSVRPIE